MIGNLIGLVTGGFSNYIMMGLAAIVAVLVIMLGFSKYEVSQLETNVANLEQEIILKKVQIKGLEGDIRVKDFVSRMREEDNKVLDAHNKTMVNDNDALLETIEDLSNAKPDDDGKVAPVLNNYLNNR